MLPPEDMASLRAENVRQLSQRMGEAVSGINNLSQLTTNGQVWIDPDGADGIRKALGDAKIEVEQMLDEARYLDRKLPLGNNEVGSAIVGKFQNRANGGDASLVGVLTKYYEAIEAAEANVDKAIQNYRETEEANRGRFG